MVGTSPSTLRRCLGRLERLGLLTHECRRVIDESTDTLQMTDVYQLHVGAAPDWAAPRNGSQGSRPTGPHRQSESASKPADQHSKTHKGKVTALKVSEVVNHATRLALTVSNFAEALSNWFS